MALTRYKVTMLSISAAPDGGIFRHEATDYVDTDHLDVYVADARSRWQSVVVSDQPDDGPGGPDGAYDLNAALNSPEV